APNAPAPEPADAPREGAPSGPWRGGTLLPVQGGGLRLENLPRVLPENILHLRASYGDVLLALAVWGALLALLQRPMLFLATVPYAILALLFFSCWSKPDPRHLSGVHVLLPLLIVEGTLGTADVVRRLARGGRIVEARGLAAGFALALGVAMLVVDHTLGT